MQSLTLDHLPLGADALIQVVHGDDSLATRLMEMGFIDGSPVKAIGCAPLGDPREYLIRGSRVSLRSSEAQRIAVERL
jgi:ferrous iron transport protein A